VLQAITLLPFASITWPVIQEEAFDARKSAALATSDGIPIGRSGRLRPACACISGAMYCSMRSLHPIEGAIASDTCRPAVELIRMIEPRPLSRIAGANEVDSGDLVALHCKNQRGPHLAA
jgi:hypothetical protein